MLVSHDVSVISKSANKLACVNVNVAFHDVSGGVKKGHMTCLYPDNLQQVPDHHH
jgi:hypothetical protein